MAQRQERNSTLLIKSVLNIRYQYLKMYEYKKSALDEDVNYYLRLNKVQEALYQAGLITLEELKLGYKVRTTPASVVAEMVHYFLDSHGIEFTSFPKKEEEVVADLPSVSVSDCLGSVACCL